MFAAALAAMPLFVAAQEPAQPPAPPQYPPQYTPPAQYTPPPPPSGLNAPAPQLPPQDRFVPPAPYVPPAPGQYAAPPQAQPPPQYAPPPQARPPQYAPPPQAQPVAAQYAPPPAYTPRQSSAPPAQTFQPPGRQRDSWYIGFGLGGGDGNIEDAAGTFSFEEFFGKSPTTVSLNFKVGATLTPQLLLGLDISGVSSGASEGSATATLTIVNYDGVLTFFPMGEGLFVRGGLGLSRLSFEVTGTAFDGGVDYTGTNVTFGGGYAFWLGRTFNLTLNLDYSAQFWGDNDGGTTGPKRSDFWALGLGFDWY
jgi:hypothetical protein